MTEEIIVDVTKCDFNTFDGGGSQRTICTLDNCFCDGIRNKDCYYKQLKRLEQENKELKEENERLREELNLHLYGTDDKMIHTLYGQPIQYWIEKKEALDGANLLIKGYHLLIKKYRSALEEIRILATKNVSIENFVKIQNKINEVLQ